MHFHDTDFHHRVLGVGIRKLLKPLTGLQDFQELQDILLILYIL